MTLSMILFLTIQRTPRSTLFPYTTLFRSEQSDEGAEQTDQQADRGNDEEPAVRERLEGIDLVAEGQELLGHAQAVSELDRKSTRLNSSHLGISYAVFCLKKKKKKRNKYK